MMTFYHSLYRCVSRHTCHCSQSSAIVAEEDNDDDDE